MADAELIRLVLTQLIDNACRYSSSDSPIEIETGADDQTAFVTVTNVGRSLPVHEQGRMFKRFFRGEQARQSSSGSGLGLYVARKIAVAHSGTLELVDSAFGAVVFRLNLPLHVG